jgi:hypothetical protein
MSSEPRDPATLCMLCRGRGWVADGSGSKPCPVCAEVERAKAQPTDGRTREMF